MGQAKQRGTQAERIAAAKTIKEQNVTYEQPPSYHPRRKQPWLWLCC